MNPADLTLSISPSLTSKPTLPPLSLSSTNAKPGKTPVPRIDLEPIYTQLKVALGEQWNDYKTAVNQFVLGNLSQAELSWVLQPCLSAAPSVITSGAAGGPNGAVTATGLVSTLTLHNTLITAIYANTLRDTPPSDLAPWVVATDKPSSSSKTGSGAGGGANDKAEERLRKEVMAVHARDRRRIKTLKVGEGGERRGVNDPVGEMRAFRDEMGGVRSSASGDGGAAGGAGQSAGGGMGAKTNWDIEIRRRYAAPLAGETLEFPSLPDLQTRIEPICYEEGLTSGTAPGSLQPCAEILEQATEVFLKELLGAMFANTRANGEGCIQTAEYKRRLRKEEEDVEAGVGGVVRNAGGWLPVEMEVQAKREALGMEDLRLAIMLDDNYLKQDRFLSKKVVLSRQPELHARPEKAPKVNGIFAKPTLNGTLTNSERANLEEAVVDGDGEAAWSWRGSSKADVSELMGVLDECLAVG